MTGTRFVSAGDIAWAVDETTHRSPMRTHSGQPVAFLHGVHFGVQCRRLAHRIGNIQIAIFTLTVDTKLCDALINQINRFQGHIPSLARCA